MLVARVIGWRLVQSTHSPRCYTMATLHHRHTNADLFPPKKKQVLRELLQATHSKPEANPIVHLLYHTRQTTYTSLSAYDTYHLFVSRDETMATFPNCRSKEDIPPQNENAVSPRGFAPGWRRSGFGWVEHHAGPGGRQGWRGGFEAGERQLRVHGQAHPKG